MSIAMCTRSAAAAAAAILVTVTHSWGWASAFSSTEKTISLRTTPSQSALFMSSGEPQSPLAKLKLPANPFASEGGASSSSLVPQPPDALPEPLGNDPEAIFARARAVMSADLGVRDGSLLAENFVWIGPNVAETGSLDKEEYLAAGKFFDLRSAYPDLDYRAHDFRLDARDPLTVRVTARTVGTMRGELRLRTEAMPPNGKRLSCPPEAISITFDKVTGKVVKLCTGFTMDRLVGNTAGLCGVMAAATVAGAPPSEWEIYPPAVVLSRFFGRSVKQLEEPTSFLAPFPETVMIQLAKGVIAADNGASDPDVLAPSFSFCGPVVGPIGKNEFVEAFGNFKLKDAFPDLETDFSNFRVDPYDPYRVWVDARGSGTWTGQLLGKDGNGAKYEGPPEAISFTFDDDGFCTRLTAGAVMDPTVGNTGGLGGVYGIFYATGQPLPGIATRPIPQILSRLQKKIAEPITGVPVDDFSSMAVAQSKAAPALKATPPAPKVTPPSVPVSPPKVPQTPKLSAPKIAPPKVKQSAPAAMRDKKVDSSAAKKAEQLAAKAKPGASIPLFAFGQKDTVDKPVDKAKAAAERKKREAGEKRAAAAATADKAKAAAEQKKREAEGKRAAAIAAAEQKKSEAEKKRAAAIAAAETKKAALEQRKRETEEKRTAVSAAAEAKKREAEEKRKALEAKKTAAANAKKAEQLVAKAKPGASIALFFGGQKDDDTESKKKVAAANAKKAEQLVAKAKPGASIPLFGFGQKATDDKTKEAAEQKKREAEGKRAATAAAAAEQKKREAEKKRAAATAAAEAKKAALEQRKREAEEKRTATAAAAEAKKVAAAAAIEAKRTAAASAAEAKKREAEEKRKALEAKKTAAANAKKAEQLVAKAKPGASIALLFGGVKNDDTAAKAKKAEETVAKAKRGASIPLFGFGGQADDKSTKAKQAEELAAKAKPRGTISLFGFGGEKDVSVQSTKAPASKKAAATASAAPKGVPTLVRWRRNFDGSVTGFISGSKAFNEGERITTSTIKIGDLNSGNVVETESGSRYFLV